MMTGTWKCLDCNKPITVRKYSPPKATVRDKTERAEIEATYEREKGKPLCKECWLTRLRLDGRYRKAAKVGAADILFPLPFGQAMCEQLVKVLA